jgi:hypothetical protein
MLGFGGRLRDLILSLSRKRQTAYHYQIIIILILRKSELRRAVCPMTAFNLNDVATRIPKPHTHGNETRSTCNLKGVCFWRVRKAPPKNLSSLSLFGIGHARKLRRHSKLNIVVGDGWHSVSTSKGHTKKLRRHRKLTIFIGGGWHDLLIFRAQRSWWNCQLDSFFSRAIYLSPRHIPCKRTPAGTVTHLQTSGADGPSLRLLLNILPSRTDRVAVCNALNVEVFGPSFIGDECGSPHWPDNTNVIRVEYV